MLRNVNRKTDSDCDFDLFALIEEEPQQKMKNSEIILNK